MTSHRFSMAPLAALAREMSTPHGKPAPNFDELLATLFAADRQLDEETNQLRRSLEAARSQLAVAEKARAVAERERDEAHALNAEAHGLQQLVEARENAHDAQGRLVRQLKEDNHKLRDSYEAAMRRAGDSPAFRALANAEAAEAGRGGDRRVSVTVGGSRRDMRFSDAELVHVFKENERLEQAGQTLIAQVEMQKDAHEKLRDTVSELMAQLQDASVERETRDQETRTEVAALKRQLAKVNAECAQKDVAGSNLQRQLNKVQAEFHAISVAHSYSSAELSKLRVAVRANKKTDRERYVNGGFSGAVLGGVENLLHHRRNAN